MMSYVTAHHIGIATYAFDNPAPTIVLDYKGTPSTYVNYVCGEPGGGGGILVQQHYGVFDTTPPTAPTNLAARDSGSSVNLTWTASSDNGYVAAYQVFRNGLQIATTTSAVTVYIDTPVSQSTDYAYTVTALDASANSSPSSNPVTVGR
jgi:hypothetical protein